MLQHNISIMLMTAQPRSSTPIFATPGLASALPPAYFQAIAPLHELVQHVRTGLPKQPFLDAARLQKDSIRHLMRYAEANPHPLYSLSIHQGDLRLPPPYPNIIQLDYSPATIDMAISGLERVDDSIALRHLLHRIHYIKSVLAMLATTDVVGTAQALGQHLSRQTSLVRGLHSAQVLIDTLGKATPNNHIPSVELSKNLSELAHIITDLKTQPQLTPYLPLLNQLTIQITEVPRDIPAIPVAVLARQVSSLPASPPAPLSTPYVAAAATPIKPPVSAPLVATVVTSLGSPRTSTIAPPSNTASSQSIAAVPIPAVADHNSRPTTAPALTTQTLSVFEPTNITHQAVVTVSVEAASPAATETVTLPTTTEARSDASPAPTLTVTSTDSSPTANTSPQSGGSTSDTAVVLSASEQQPVSTADTVTATPHTAAHTAEVVAVATQETPQAAQSEPSIAQADVPAGQPTPAQVLAPPPAVAETAVLAVEPMQNPAEALPAHQPALSAPHDSTHPAVPPSATPDLPAPLERINTVVATETPPPAVDTATITVTAQLHTTTDNSGDTGEQAKQVESNAAPSNRGDEKRSSFWEAAEHVCGQNCPIHGTKTHTADTHSENVTLPTSIDFGSADTSAGNTASHQHAEPPSSKSFAEVANHICGSNCPIHGVKAHTADAQGEANILPDLPFGDGQKTGVTSSIPSPTPA